MTERIDFYVLKTASTTQRWVFACRLAEKAYLRDLRVGLLSDTLADANTLDELLWTFTERSFVPHAVCRAGAPVATTAVRLSPDIEAVGEVDLLVNLSGRLPVGFDRFSRLVEIVDADVDCRRLGRERFKSYRELKIRLETHQLDDTVNP